MVAVVVVAAAVVVVHMCSNEPNIAGRTLRSPGILLPPASARQAETHPRPWMQLNQSNH